MLVERARHESVDDESEDVENDGDDQHAVVYPSVETRSTTTNVSSRKENAKEREKSGERDMSAVAHENGVAEEVSTGTEHVAMDAFPATVVTHGQLVGVLVVLLGVPKVIERKRAHHDQSDETGEEDDDDEAVEDTEPVDFALEEVEFEVAVEAVVERERRLHELHRGCDMERAICRHNLRVGRCHVHLDDMIVVVANCEETMRVHASLAWNHLMVALRLERTQQHDSLALHGLDFLLRHVKITHLRPDRKTVDLQLVMTRRLRPHLIPVVVEDGLLQPHRILLRENPMD